MLKKAFPVEQGCSGWTGILQSGKDGHDKILAEFAAGDADMLVGTQMIVKGHDFENCYTCRSSCSGYDSLYTSSISLQVKEHFSLLPSLREERDEAKKEEMCTFRHMILKIP